MTRSRRNGAALTSFVMPLFASLAFTGPSAAQRTAEDSYLLGEENGLEIVVYVLGEVQRPGEYRVNDFTDVLELISKAGGPTEFASLANVSLRRRDTAGLEPGGQRILEVNVSEFLSHEDAPPLPGLGPGDVVTVPRNKKAKWRTAFTMVRDLSVVVTAYLLYLRVEQNN